MANGKEKVKSEMMGLDNAYSVQLHIIGFRKMVE